MCICIDIINDFINSASSQSGYGCFEGVEIAAKFARSLSVNARQKFRRYRTVPIQFFLCLQGIGVLDGDQIPEHAVAIDTAKAIMEAAGLRERLKLSEYFDLGLQIQSGSQEQVWKKLEIMKRQPKKLNLFDRKGQ